MRIDVYKRQPMSLSLTSRPLTLCRKSVGMSNATGTAGAKQLPSQACFIVPIAAASSMSTVPTKASVFLNIPVPNTAKSQLESSARPVSYTHLVSLVPCRKFSACSAAARTVPGTTLLTDSSALNCSILRSEEHTSELQSQR